MKKHRRPRKRVYSDLLVAKSCPTEEGRAFVRGFAAACAELVATHDQPTMARSMLDGVGLRLAHLWDASVEKFDLKVLEPLFSKEKKSG